MNNYQNQLRNNHDQDNDSDDEEKRTLFCANLSEQVTEEILYELFMQAGPIEHIKIPKESDGKRQKTFGFITYTHKCTIPYALQLYDGVRLFKRNLIIKIRNGGDNRNMQRNSNHDNRTYNNGLPIINNVDDNKYNLLMAMHTNQLAAANQDNINYLVCDNILGLNPFMNPTIQQTFATNPNSCIFTRRGDQHDDQIYKHASRSTARHHDKPYSRNDHSRRNHDYNRRNDRYSEQRRHR